MPGATVRFVDGMRFVGTSASGHAVVMDAPKEVGGYNTGPTPWRWCSLRLEAAREWTSSRSCARCK